MDHVGSYSESLKIKSCFSTHTHTHKYVLLLPSSVLGSFILFYFFYFHDYDMSFSLSLSLSLSLSFSFFFSIVSVSLIGELSRLTRSRRTIYTHLYLLFLFSRKKQNGRKVKEEGGGCQDYYLVGPQRERKKGKH